MKPKIFNFRAIGAKQSSSASVFTFAANAEVILEMCEITRAGRTDQGSLFGFQRPQIAGHIEEIKDYLQTADAVLPNAIVAGFLGGVSVKKMEDGVYSLTITVGESKPGFIVDGQQRLTALAKSARRNFEVFVSTVLCKDEEELRRQFILINNTKPLPKSLIYELLPEVTALPKRLGARAFSAALASRLNSDPQSALHGMIHTHTNPTGIIKDTAIQKVIMNSADGGAIREHLNPESRLQFSFELLSNFFSAVRKVFPQAWDGHTPRTSRLIHGAGIVSLGYVMETIYSLTGSFTEATFATQLRMIERDVAWTSGTWKFADGGIVKWNEIENTPRQIQRLALHLVSLVKKKQQSLTPLKAKRK